MKMLQDGHGNTSSMRFMALFCTITACGIGILAVVLNRDLSGAGVLIGAILAPTMAGKWLQSREELKHE
jgi:NhaP-type Na+/H+ or K+/H+ antiporter